MTSKVAVKKTQFFTVEKLIAETIRFCVDAVPRSIQVILESRVKKADNNVIGAFALEPAWRRIR